MAKIELEYVQHLILFDAADLANAEIPNEDFRYNNGQRAMLQGEVFHADPVRSTRGGLCLSLDPVIALRLSKKSITRLHEIGRKSLKRAILNNKEHFVGVIVGEARQGRNYFDRFIDHGQQTRLF